jgi:hypothetical protein
VINSQDASSQSSHKRITNDIVEEENVLADEVDHVVRSQPDVILTGQVSQHIRTRNTFALKLLETHINCRQ